MVGVNLNKEGQLTVDTDALRGHLQTHFNDVRDLFAATGTTSKGTLEYVSHQRATEAGDYAVNITQAATKSTTTSDAGVLSTLGYDEVLTLTSEGRTASVELSSTMAMPDILNAINTELDKVYTQNLTGSEQLYADSGQAQAITSATTWDAIFDAGGASAALQNGDVISFTGTSRAALKYGASTPFRRYRPIRSRGPCRHRVGVWKWGRRIHRPFRTHIHLGQKRRETASWPSVSTSPRPTTWNSGPFRLHSKAVTL